MRASKGRDNMINKGRMIVQGAGLVVILGLGVAMSGCAEGEARVGATKVARLVETFRVEKHSDVHTVEYVGRVSAPKEVELGFELAGRVEDISEITGVAFKAGEELGRLESTRYKLAYEEAEQRLAYAEKELGRVRSLLQKGSSTQSEFDRVENAAILARISCVRAKRDLQDCVLVAPFDGKLAAKHIEEGSFVGAGQSVLVFQEIGKTEVEVYRTEDQLVELLSALRRGVAEVGLADGVLKGARLVIKDYATTPDQLSGAYRVTFLVDAPDYIELFPGAPVRLSVVEQLGVLNSRPVEIPSDALVGDGSGGFRVWLLEDGSIHPTVRGVEVGRVGGRLVEIVEGLTLGDRVVTSGSSLLRVDSVITTNEDV